MNSNSRKKANKIVRESLEQRSTEVKQSWTAMMEDLAKEIKHDVTLDDAGNYNVCGCEPHYISIRPIVHDIYDVVAFKDGSDRQKKLYMRYEELKKYIKEILSSKTLNYVDSAYDKNIENSKDKEGNKKSDKAAEENVVDPEKDNKPAKKIKAEPMNKEEDDPTQPMREVGKFEKLIDRKSKKPDYTPPKLPKNLQKLVVKYTKAGKQRKK